MDDEEALPKDDSEKFNPENNEINKKMSKNNDEREEKKLLREAKHEERKLLREVHQNEKKLLKNLPRYDRKLCKGILRGPGKIMILWLINKKRAHGYELMTQLQGDSPVSEKLKTPSPSKIYPILHDLEKNGLIKGTWEYHGKRKLKYYEITGEGVNTLSRIRNIYKLRKSALFEEFMNDMFFTDRK